MIEPVVERERAALMTRTMTYAVLIGLFLAAAWVYRKAYYNGAGFPENTFLFSPGNHFADLYNFFRPLRAHDPLGYGFAVYPPFSYIVMEPFVWVGWTPSIALFILITLVGVGGFLARQLDFLTPIDRIAAVFALTFVTYPFLFSVDRGNIEIVITVLLVILAWAWQTDRWLAAALAIGAATAMKGYPIVFAAPLLIQRQWRGLAVVVVSAALLTLLGSIYYSFDVVHTWNLLHDRLTFYNNTYVIGDAGLAYSTSLFSPLKLLIVDVFGGDANAIRSAITIYQAATVVLFAGVVWVMWRARDRMKLWQQMTLLVCMLNLLPTVSADYKLMHLIVPIGLFLREGGRDRWRWIYTALFALLLIPKSYDYVRPAGAVSIAVVINPLLMTAIALMIIVSVLRPQPAEAEAEPEAPVAPAAQPGYSPA